MHKRVLIITIAVLISFANYKVAEAQKGEWTGNVNLFLGTD